jgi:hypothetical protein
MAPKKRDAVFERLARLRRECWQSPWRGARRDPETDLPSKYVRLNAVEMRHAALTGGVAIAEREALRLGLIDPPEPEPEEPADILDAIAQTAKTFRAAAGQVPA